MSKNRQVTAPGLSGFHAAFGLARPVHLPWAMTMLGSPLLFVSFLVMPAVSCVLCLLFVRHLVNTGTLTQGAFRRFGVGLFVWVTAWGAVGVTEVLNVWDSVPPRMMVAMPILFGVTLAIGFSRFGELVARHASYAVLIGFQSFRLVLEVLLYRASVEGVMPPQMSFSGWNFDVLTGLSALVIVLLTRGGEVPRWVAWAFNLFGITLLTIILTIAVASMPTFAAFGAERTNTWITQFPYVYLPAVMVQLALLGHVLLLRKLRSDAARPSATGTPGTAPSRLRASET